MVDLPPSSLRGGGAGWAPFPFLSHSARGPASCPHCPLQADGADGGGEEIHRDLVGS